MIDFSNTGLILIHWNSKLFKQNKEIYMKREFNIVIFAIKIHLQKYVYYDASGLFNTNLLSFFNYILQYSWFLYMA